MSFPLAFHSHLFSVLPPSFPIFCGSSLLFPDLSLSYLFIINIIFPTQYRSSTCPTILFILTNSSLILANVVCCQPLSFIPISSLVFPKLLLSSSLQPTHPTHPAVASLSVHSFQPTYYYPGTTHSKTSPFRTFKGLCSEVAICCVKDTGEEEVLSLSSPPDPFPSLQVSSPIFPYLCASKYRTLHILPFCFRPTT